jgi:hypothetical protein
MTGGVRSLIAFAVGFGGGWAARSLADTPQGVGVKVLEVAIKTKERLGRWVAVERERLEDMVAEAQSRVEPTGASTAGGSGHRDNRNQA